MARFTQNFTLEDIFSNPKLKNKLPNITLKEKESEDGRVSVRTSAKSVNRQVFDTATSAARPFYKPILTKRMGDTLIIGGELVGDHDAAVDAVYKAILSKRLVLLYTANNADMIRDAMKESAKNKRYYGTDTKLYLRAQSMMEIEGMNNRQIQALLNDIMENLMYSDNFPKTQKKYDVANELTNIDYATKRLKWKQKVGDL